MQRRKFIQQSSIGLLGTLAVTKHFPTDTNTTAPFFATGLKTGEITANTAIVWARLTSAPERINNPSKVPQSVYLDESTGEWHPTDYFKKQYKQDRPDRTAKVIMPDGADIHTIDGATPGISGTIQLFYKLKNSNTWQESTSKKVDESTDYTCQFTLNNLQSNSEYTIKLVSGDKKSTQNTIEGQFKTAPTAKDAADIHFMVTTCHEYNDQDDPQGGGFKIFKEMLALKPDFLVHTGDVIYHDQISKNLEIARWNWQRMTSLTNSVAFYKQVPCYFMKDDHDTWMNDCHPKTVTKFMGDFTFNQGVELFKQQVPNSPLPYRTFRWGKDLQIWLVDGREYRTSEAIPDGPNKTIWGKEQMNWFKETYTASDATFKILISPTPIIGPDRPQKKDNHSNKGFSYEGEMIRNFIAGHENTFVICGDRHWQYVSQHKQTGTYEFACGPASNEHAGGWKKDEILPEHQYLNVVGGFLQVAITHDVEKVHLTLTHRSVDGKTLFAKHFNQKKQSV
jgi:alkaline phosphatase D